MSSRRLKLSNQTLSLRRQMSVIGRKYFFFVFSATTVWWQSPYQFNKNDQQQGAAKDRGHPQLFSYAGQAICRQHARHGKNSIFILVSLSLSNKGKIPFQWFQHLWNIGWWLSIKFLFGKINSVFAIIKIVCVKLFCIMSMDICFQNIQSSIT